MLYLGMFPLMAHTFSMEVSRCCELAVCMCCTVMCEVVSARLRASSHICAMNLYCFTLTARGEVLPLWSPIKESVHPKTPGKRKNMSF